MQGGGGGRRQAGGACVQLMLKQGSRGVCHVRTGNNAGRRWLNPI
jgi:hypothetical protein